MVGMGHLQPAVIGLDLARDQAAAPDRQQAAEIGRVGVEIDELERAGGVFDQNLVWRAHAAAAATPGPMLGHGHFEGGDLADARFGDAGRRGAVDHPLRQVPEQIDHARMGGGVARGHELVQQALDLGPDAAKASRRRKQRG